MRALARLLVLRWAASVTIVAVAATAIADGRLRAQQSAAPGQTAPAAGAAQPLNMAVPQVNGTGAISGVVTDAVTKKPLAGVTVYLGPPNRGPVDQPLRQYSDSQGRFVFRDLPPSDAYFINSNKSGYFDGHSGATTSTQLGARIAVADGQWVNDVSIVMTPASTLTGVVMDEFGDPVVGAFVRALPEFLISGQPHLVEGPAVMTDDRGVYRLSGLRSGKYLLQVPIVQESVPSTMTALQMIGQTPEAASATVAAGRPLRNPDPTMDVDGTTQLLVGRYVTGPGTSGGRPTAYAPVFYPNAASPSSAAAIDLAAGEIRSGLDFQLTPKPVNRVSGHLDGPPDALANLTVRLFVPGTEDLGRGSEVATAFVDSSGTFTFVNVPAGTYTIDARRSLSWFVYSDLATPTTGGLSAVGLIGGTGRSVIVAAAPAGTRITTEASSGEANYSARVPVTVVGQDLSGIVLPLRRGASLLGHIAYDDGQGLTGQGGPLPNLEPAHGESSLGSPRSTADPNHREAFRFDGLLPGEYVLHFLGVTVKSIVSEGKDYTYAPFDASDGHDFTDVTVTLVRESSVLAGTVRDDKGTVSKTAGVIVFPVESAQWSGYGFSPPRIKSASVNTSGLYRFQNLPAGDYYVAAVDPSQLDDWKDPQFLQALARTATKTTMSWGGRVTQDLILAAGR